MTAFLRLLHVFAVALWFGAVVFFTITGVLLFQAFAEEASKENRDAWFPVPAAFERPSFGPGFPDPLRLEQGNRAAGVAVSKILPVYYALQAGCAIVALLTALLLAGASASRVRVGLAVLGLATVLLGWWLEVEVASLRKPRNDLTDALLMTASPSSEQIEAARMARATFGRWHGYSLVQNFTTLVVAAGLVLLVPALSRPGTNVPARGD